MSESEMSEPQQNDVMSTVFSLLGKAHTLAILKKFVLDDGGPIRFGEFQDELDLSPNTLSRQLDELVDADFLERTQYDEIPPRVEYEATEMWNELVPMFRKLKDWMERDCAEQFGNTGRD